MKPIIFIALAFCAASARWSFTFIELDSSHQGTRYGIAAGDLTADGYPDVVAGRDFYRNPGVDMTGEWTRVSLPIDCNPLAIMDLDRDERGDVVAAGEDGLYWLEATDRHGSSWTSTKTVSLSNGLCHSCAQGYATGQLEAGGFEEICVNIDGITCFKIADQPTGIWQKIALTADISVGIGIGDIDGDGDNDVCGGHTEVWWLENPGSVSPGWVRHDIAPVNVVDRVAAADMNGDSRCDIVVTEEGSGRLIVYGNTGGSWEEHVVSSTALGYLSMHTADFDRDGTIDIVTGESLNSKKIEIWENDGSFNFTPHQINASRAVQTHIGCLPADLDNDGDLDLVNHSYTQSRYVFVWRNDHRPATAVFTNRIQHPFTVQATPLPPVNMCGQVMHGPGAAPGWFVSINGNHVIPAAKIRSGRRR
jgi:hypothetical protein